MANPRTAPVAVEACSGLETDFGWTLGVVFRAYRRYAAVVVDDLPGGPRGFQVLVASARDEPGSQSSLANRLGVDRTVMTYLLDDLVEAGLVQRQADPADRRSHRVVATERGQALLAELQGRLVQVEEQVLAGLDEKDRVVLRSILKRLAAFANDLHPVTSAGDAASR